jgi:peptide/nickel transport system permease protein
LRLPRRAFRIGAAIFVVLALATLLYPELSGIDPTKMECQARASAPPFIGAKSGAGRHPLGTDQIGRDMLVRSARRPALLASDRPFHRSRHAAIGCSLGTIAGYFGGRVHGIMRLTDAQLSIPMIILAITVLGVSRPDHPGDHPRPRPFELAGLCPRHAQRRDDRAQREYVRAAKSVRFATDFRIILTPAAPLVLPPIIFTSVLDVARMMIFESTSASSGWAFNRRRRPSATSSPMAANTC